MCNMFITLGRQNERLVNPEGAIERLWLPAYIEKLKTKYNLRISIEVTRHKLQKICLRRLRRGMILGAHFGQF